MVSNRQWQTARIPKRERAPAPFRRENENGSTYCDIQWGGEDVLGVCLDLEGAKAPKYFVHCLARPCFSIHNRVSHVPLVLAPQNVNLRLLTSFTARNVLYHLPNPYRFHSEFIISVHPCLQYTGW